MKRFPIGLLVVATLVFSEARAPAGDWPGFRGPTGCGLSDDKHLPMTWDGTSRTNVLWDAELPGSGISGPIVWNDRVFAMTASRKPVQGAIEQYLSCFEATRGTRLWNTTVPSGPWKRSHTGRPGGGFASATPVTDGQRIYALYGTSTLAAIDFDGKIVWQQALTPFNYDVEMATSPVLFENTVIVFCGMRNGSRLVAFHRATGDIVWDKDLKDTGYGHNTPLIVDVAGAPRMILMGAGLSDAKNAIQGFDPKTGERLWWCAGRGETASAVRAGGHVFCDSGRGGLAKMLDPSGSADVSLTHVKWKASIPQGLGSPLVVGNFIYRLHDNFTFTCWDLDSGRKVYQERVGDLTSNWASPIADGHGRIYLVSGGTSLVVESGPQFKVLAVNKLGDPNHSSPAAANGRLYIAGEQRLYAIGAK